jgi:hypothetical protein
MKLPLTIDAVNRELHRRRACGEAAPDAQINDFAMAAISHGDGTLFLRCVFTLTDGTALAIDSSERFVVDSTGLHEVRLN